jgi:hypothetical protein
MQVRGVLLATISLASLVYHPCHAAVIRIDLGMDSGRSDTATEGWHEWQVPDGSQAKREFDGVQITLSSGKNGQPFTGQWFKAGLATGATMATDGIAVRSNQAPASLQIEIAGLPPGPHTLTTFHNAVGSQPLGIHEVSVAGATTAVRVEPSHRAPSNREAQSGYLQFQAIAGKPVLIRIDAPRTGTDSQVILNGLVIDGSDPHHRTHTPSPADRDWHVDGDAGQVTLRWESADSAVAHQIYYTADNDPARAAQIVERATPDTDAYLGQTEQNRWELSLPPGKSLRHSSWRVDSIDREGHVTKGDTWQFRTRQLAFPGAEGYGRFAIGGRGGRVFKVTHLGDTGPGSLRAAIEADVPRTVLFDVGGRIVLRDKLVVRNPYLTLAGQTAPGKGICISNFNLGLMGTHDCILRFLRVRPGNTAGVTLDGMGMASTDHSIIDHCSISWTQDEAFSSRGAHNITLQRTLISEALNVAGHKKYKPGTQHGYAASIGGDVGSFHHNLLAHCAGRNWSLAGGIDKASVHAGRLDIRNNVVYNWSHRTTDGGAKEVNFVNNYYRPGPASRVFHAIKPEHQLPFGPQEYYVLGNVMEGRYGADQRYAAIAESPHKPMAEYLVDEPFFESFVTTTSAAQALQDVLADVGCNRPALDDHDTRVLEEVRAKTTTYQGSVTGLPGLPDSQEDVGGWEDYPHVQRPANWDSDGDGLPDWWERRHHLNPQSPTEDQWETHADPDENGYTHLEEYLHWMATPGNEVPQ